MENQIEIVKDIDDIIDRFSGENLIKLQKYFVGLYGNDIISQEKANSFAVGFGKACELIVKELRKSTCSCKCDNVETYNGWGNEKCIRCIDCGRVW